MRKSNTQPIQDVIHDLLRELKIDRKLKEVGLVSEWENLMGKTVAVRTNQIYIRNRVLYVTVTSAVLRNELLMMRQDIIHKLNERAGEVLVEQMIVR